MDCSICFQQEQKIYTCKCGSIICYLCLGMNCDILIKENKVPNCFECRINIIPSDFTGELKIKILNCYTTSINNGFFLEIFSQKFIADKIIEDIKIKRQKDILQGFPKVILKTINIIHKDELKKIEKKVFKDYKLEISNKKCLNQFCDGILINNACHKCGIIFCEFCEKEKKGLHICNQEDIDSVRQLNKMSKCPKCLSPCEKISGCNNITCPICKINFDYVTGQETKYGNHHDLTIKLKDKNSPSIRLQDSEFKTLVIKFESLKPKDFNGDDIIIMSRQNKDISELLRRYFTHCEISNKFNKALYEIDKMIDIRDYNCKVIKKYIDSF